MTYFDNQLETCIVAAPPDVSQNGAGSSTLLRAGSSKLDAIRNWGVSTYKCTKQILYEKLGKSSRTVDTGELLLIIFWNLLSIVVTI